MKILSRKSDSPEKVTVKKPADGGILKKITRKRTAKKVAPDPVTPDDVMKDTVLAAPNKVGGSVMMTAMGPMRVYRRTPLMMISKPKTICCGHRMQVCKVRSHKFKLV